MPRIPTRDSLRQAVPGTSGGIVAAPRDHIGPALQKTGKQLFGAATKRTADQQLRLRDQQQRSALELARARSQWNANLFAEQQDYTLERNQDSDNWSKTYQSRANAWQQQAAGLISDPEVRRQFIAETGSELAQTGRAIGQRAHELNLSVQLEEADVALQQQVRTAAAQTDEDGKATMGGVRASLQDMVQTGLIQAEEAAARSIGYAQRYASLKTTDLTQRDPALAVSVLSDEEPGAAMLIRQFEGFRATPYWRAGTNRAGYGSDTVTRENGAVEEVVPGMTVSRQDADRDLLRRISETRARIGDQVGQQVIRQFTPAVQAALVSVGYQSGDLPDKVAAAVRTGDVEAIAAAIEVAGEEEDGDTQHNKAELAAIVRAEEGNLYDQVARRPAWVGVLEPELKAQLHAAASTELERADNRRLLAERTFVRRLGRDIRSDVRSVYANGKSTGTDDAEVLQELGQDGHRQWTEVRQDAAEVHDRTRDMAVLPDDEIARIVETMRPQPKADDFARKTAIHNRILSRALDIRQERRDNPARAAMRVGSVRRALSEAQDMAGTTPDKVQALVREMQAVQLTLGTPKPRIAPVPDEWAFEIGRALAAIPARQGSSNAGEVAGEVQELYAHIKRQFGEFADEVFSYSFARARTLSRARARHISRLVNPQAAGQ